MTHDTGPVARGVRIDWDDLPAAVHAWVERAAGAPVVSTATTDGGFSPGVASRVRLADGREVFVKAAGAALNPWSPEMHRREADVVGRLPAQAPVPRLIAVHDDGDWVGLMYESVRGRQPRVPWDAAELARVVAAVDGLHDVLTPAPAGISAVHEVLGDAFDGWRQLAADGAGAVGDDVDPWVRRHLDRLAGLEATWEHTCAGDTLLHLDLRADNLLVTDDRVVVVDWPSAGVGARFLDVVGMAPAVRMQGGPDPEHTLGLSRAARGADPDAVTTAVVAVAGYFTHQRRRPPPPGLPTVRRFQAAQGDVAVAWLRQRTGWR